MPFSTSQKDDVADRIHISDVVRDDPSRERAQDIVDRGRTSATEVLSGIKGGGALEIYLGAKALEPFINKDLVLERFVPFRLIEVEGLGKAVKGLPAELFVEICQGFVAALQASED